MIPGKFGSKTANFHFYLQGIKQKDFTEMSYNEFIEIYFKHMFNLSLFYQILEIESLIWVQWIE